MWSFLALVYGSKEACGWLDIFGVGDLLDPVNIQTQPSLLQWLPPSQSAGCPSASCIHMGCSLQSLPFHAKPFTATPTLWPKTKLCFPKIIKDEALVSAYVFVCSLYF